MTFIPNKTGKSDLVERWPYDFQHIGTGDKLYEYLGVYANELRRIDVFIDELYEQRFLKTATGRELEKLAAEIKVTRQPGETDDSLRFRARLRKAIAASDGTASHIAHIFGLAFGEDNLDSIDVSYGGTGPVTQFDIPTTLLNDIPLNRSEFESELERGFPAGHAVSIVTSDTWLLDQSGSQGVGKGELI